MKLYIKRHQKTGLKYFGMTQKRDHITYTGSGKYWLRHLNTHGNDVITCLIKESNDLELMNFIALEFSEMNNIVSSKEWANLVIEDASPGNAGYKWTDEQKVAKGKKMQGKDNHFYGKTHTQETKDKLSLQKKGQSTGQDNPNYNGKCHTPEVRQRMMDNQWDRSKENHPLWEIGHTQATKDNISKHKKMSFKHNNILYDTMKEAMATTGLSRYKITQRGQYV